MNNQPAPEPELKPCPHKFNTGRTRWNCDQCRLEDAERALSQIAVACGHSDPADGEGTWPHEIVQYVRDAMNTRATPQPHKWTAEELWQAMNNCGLAVELLNFCETDGITAMQRLADAINNRKD